MSKGLPTHNCLSSTVFVRVYYENNQESSYKLQTMVQLFEKQRTLMWALLAVNCFTVKGNIWMGFSIIDNQQWDF